MGMRPFETWPRDSNRFRSGHLALQAGVSPETVKARLARMGEEGLLAGYEVYPNVRHLGLGQTTFHLQVSDHVKASAMEDLSPVDGLVGIFDFLGSDICVDICYRDESDLSRKLRLVSKLTQQSEVARFYDRVLPPVKRPLDTIDWRIIKALRGHARRPLDEVAQDVGVSTRTVRRHHNRMEEEGAFDVVAVVNLGLIPDLSVFNLVFYLHEPQDKSVMAAIRRTFDDSFLYAWQPPSQRFGSYHASLFARNNAEMEELRRTGAAIPGVDRCDVMIPCGAQYHDSWLEDSIEAQVPT